MEIFRIFWRPFSCSLIEFSYLCNVKDTVDTFNYEIEINRQKAIIKGIQRLKKNDILVILGKGHEDYQEIKGVKYHFNDKEVVLNNI